MSQITTHILDTTLGKPAALVNIVLFREVAGEWIEISRGITNQDGRIPNFLPSDVPLVLGIYKMRFEVKAYFDAMEVHAFYPVVEIIVDIATTQHYHIPLLLNPFGYSTYRGS